MMTGEQIVVLRSLDEPPYYSRLWNAACLYGGPLWTRRVPEFYDDDLCEETLDLYAKANPDWDYF
jgi:hypothetical protein